MTDSRKTVNSVKWLVDQFDYITSAEISERPVLDGLQIHWIYDPLGDASNALHLVEFVPRIEMERSVDPTGLMLRFFTNANHQLMTAWRKQNLLAAPRPGVTPSTVMNRSWEEMKHLIRPVEPEPEPDVKPKFDFEKMWT